MVFSYARAQERGSVAILGLMVMMLLGVIGSGLLLLSKVDVEIATNHRDGIAAQYLAEAGVQLALVKLRTDINFIRETGTNNVTTTKNFNTGLTRKYTITTGPDSNSSNDEMRFIRSIGSVNKAHRQITAQILLPAYLSDSLKIIWSN